MSRTVVTGVMLMCRNFCVPRVDQCSICKDQFGEMDEDCKLLYELSS